jgi:hypothetical protein
MTPLQPDHGLIVGSFDDMNHHILRIANLLGRDRRVRNGPLAEAAGCREASFPSVRLHGGPPISSHAHSGIAKGNLVPLTI